MWQLERLLQLLHKSSGKQQLEDFIDNSKFDALVEAVKHLCKFDEQEKLEIGTPSLAL